MAITKGERAELRRIVTKRFQLLHGQVAQRENEIANAIRKQVVQEHEDALKRANEEWNEFVEEHNKVIDEFQKKLEKLEADGVKVTGGYDPRRLRAEEYPNESNRRFVVKDLNERVQEQLREMKATTGYQRLNLQTMELEIQEELAIDALETDDAKTFLARIPTVDKLLPMPDPLKALLAANGDGDA